MVAILDVSAEYQAVARGGYNEYTVREQVLGIAKKMGIKLSPEDINVSRKPDGKFSVELKYTEEYTSLTKGKATREVNLYVEQKN